MLTNTNQMLKRTLAILSLVAVAIVGVFALRSPTEMQLGSGGPFESINYPAAIGTASSPSTLTTAYAGASSTVILARGLPNVTIAGSYTPRSHGSAAYLLLERSIDEGTTFKPYTVISPTANDIDVYTNGTSTTSGIPFLIPGTGIGGATSGTAITFSFDLTAPADYIRVSAKEFTTSTAGTLNVQLQLSSN